MRKITSNPTIVVAVIMAITLAAATIACSGNRDTATATIAAAEPQAETTESTSGAGGAASVNTSESATDAQKVVSTSPVLAPAPEASQAAVPGSQAADEGRRLAGIWVDGVGTKDVDADVVIISVAVESREATVAAARAAAATSMNNVLDALRALGVGEDDIVTSSLNIYPNQVWIEVKDDVGTHSEPRITGYVVNNRVRVTVRDIELADEAVDAAAEIGGDLIRINDVSFTVGDPAAHSAEIRRRAVDDARTKAQIYAEAFGVKLGPLVFLQELSGSGRVSQYAYAMESAAAATPASKTPIESGNVSLSTTIQVGFSILP